MRVDSLEQLQSAFAQWRKTKRHAREAIPEHLLVRAQRCTGKHGVPAVVRATGVERSRLFRRTTLGEAGRASSDEGAQAGSGSVPAFSRLELSSPAGGHRPVAEVETDTGIKLRFFEQTPEILDLLGALCGAGGMK